MPSVRQRSRLASLMRHRSASCFCPRCLVSTSFLPKELAVLHEGVFSSKRQVLEKMRTAVQVRNSDLNLDLAPAIGRMVYL